MKIKLVALSLCALMCLNVITMASCSLTPGDVPSDRPLREEIIDSLPSSIESETKPSNDKDHSDDDTSTEDTTKPNDSEKAEDTTSADDTETSDTTEAGQQSNSPENGGNNTGGNTPGGNNPDENNPEGNNPPTEFEVEAQLSYHFDEDLQGYWVSACLNEATVATIPDTYESYPVIGIDSYAFSGMDRLKSVTIGNSVRYINHNAFAWNDSLERITIPDSVQVIGERAFYSCDQMSSVTIGNGVERIESEAFAWCKSLTELTLGNSVQSIASSAFEDCEALSTVVLPDSVTSLGASAFASCMNLVSVTLGRELESIGERAFAFCHKLVEIINHSTVSLSKYDGEYGFENSEMLEIHSEESKIDHVNGYLFYSCNEVNYLLGYEQTETSLTLPETYEGEEYAIYQYAFCNRATLSSVTIPAAVTEIEFNAFDGCWRLVEIINHSSLTLTAGESDAAYFALEVHSGPSKLNEVNGYLFYSYGQLHYLVSYMGADKDLILPEKYHGEPYQINDYAFYERTDLKSVRVPDAVTAIGRAAFAWSDDLTSVTLGSGLIRIEDDAFRGLSLSQLTIPASVTSIGNGILGSTDLVTIEVDESNEVYHSAGNCLIETETKTLIAGSCNSIIPSDGSVTMIAPYAFYNINGLENFVIPLGVESIDEYAFSSCYGLSSIVLPDTLAIIDDMVFHSCDDLEAVYFTSDLEDFNEIELGSGNEHLTSATVYFYSEQEPNEQGNYWHYLVEIPTPWKDDVYPNPDFENPSIPEVLPETPTTGLLYSLDEENQTCSVIGYAGDAIEIVIPDTYMGYAVTSIERGAFYGCSSLTSVSISDNVRSIGIFAFYDCYNLLTVSFGNALETIGDSAFYNCRKLTSVSIPDCVTNIYSSAFYNCDGLTDLTIGNSIQYLNDYVFAHCDSLQSVVIPATVKEIGYEAFAECKALRTVTIENGVETIGTRAFCNCERLSSIVIPDSVTSIGGSAFNSCYDLTSVTLGSGVEEIDSMAFDYCYKLVEVINHSALELNIGSSWNGSVAYYAMVIHDGNESNIQNVNGYLFYTHDTVNYLLGYVGDDLDLTLPTGYNGESYEIYSNAFYRHNDLKSVTFSDAVTSIGDEAFGWCSDLRRVILSDRVTEIGRYAFFECVDLVSVTIGSGVESIENNAFVYCYKLVEVINRSDLAIETGSSDFGNVAEYALEVHNGTTKIDSINGYLFYTYGDVHYLIGYTGSDTELVLPEDYEGEPYEIRAYAFYQNDDIRSVVIPNRVTAIGDYAFSGAYRLCSLSVGDGVKRIGEYALGACDSLSNAVFSETQGWSADSILISSDDLAEPETAAEYLVNTYIDCTWTRDSI